MDDIKLFAKNGSENCALVQMMNIYSKEVEMRFGIFEVRSTDDEAKEKLVMAETELRLIGTNCYPGETGYKYLGIVKVVASIREF